MNNLPENPTPDFPYTKPTGGTRENPNYTDYTHGGKEDSRIYYELEDFSRVEQTAKYANKIGSIEKLLKKTTSLISSENIVLEK